MRAWKTPARRSGLGLAWLVAVCFLTTAPGCQFHRTGHGFILQGRWSLEFSNNRQEPAGVASCEGGTSMAAKPELLAWRNRPKGHRLAERLLHRLESDNACLPPPLK